MLGKHRQSQGERIESVFEPMPRTAESTLSIKAIGFDIETTGVGPNDFITVACAWSPEREARCFHGEDFSEVMALLDRAEWIYTFNGIEFDLPRFAALCGRDIKPWIRKAVDPLYFMKHTMGLSACSKLNDLLRENGLEPKSGSGLQAIQLWNDGERTALADYCMDDCRLTYALCEMEAIRWKERWELRLRQARPLAFV